MATETTNTIRVCGCGCGQVVARNFKPGHDARLKGRLLAATRSADWWVAQPAIFEMVERGWGHFVDSEILACARVQSKHNGRFVESRHIGQVEVTYHLVDETGDAHSHYGCPRTEGQVRLTKGRVSGWACEACIHTESLAERVWAERRDAAALVA